MKPGTELLVSLQKLLTNGQPDGAPVSKTVPADGMGATTYTMDSIQKGDYEFEVSADGGSIWSTKVKVTIKGSII